MIIHLKHVSILVVSLYLWASEGLSERNNNLLLHILILSKIFSIPLLIYGDFNITSKQFLESGWCDKLKVTLRKAKVSTTLHGIDGRDIDFYLVSNTILTLILDIEPSMMQRGAHTLANIFC